MNFKYEPTITFEEQNEALRRACERYKKKIASLTSGRSQMKNRIRELTSELEKLQGPRTLTEKWLERAE